MAIKGKHVKIAEYLLENNADPSVSIQAKLTVVASTTIAD